MHMDHVIFSIMRDKNEVNILRNRSVKYNDFLYTYEETALDLLKKILVCQIACI